MGFCTKRHFFLLICIFQLITIIVRQVFDFLGFLWIPILVNFFDIIFIIFGSFGSYHYRTKYIIAYLFWNIFWLAWNIFIICLYLDIAGLDHKTNKVLKLDITSNSWWETGGPGCRVVPSDVEPLNINGEVTDCLVDYRSVELFQAGLQCFLAFIGCITSICLWRTFSEEDDTSSHKSSRKKNNKRMSLYSIEFSSQVDNSDDEFNHIPPPVSPKPMTPRRVKRRSVMTRGSSGRHSTSSRRQSHPRSSTRSSRRMAQNPVTKLLEQQQMAVQAYDSPASPSPIENMPNYYNSASNNNLVHHHNWQGSNGHTNPSYQQSNQSLNEPEEFEEVYNNRPASVRSSYSNFHGTRAINYNVPPPPPLAPKIYHHSHATPQVPQKRNNPNRTSLRSMAFMNNGPPAYTSQGPTPIDSETTI